ncbi:MAG TPA: histidinol-phosphate transaminase [Acidimicrobiales bacterium]
MEEITRLARPDILALQPYSSARTEGEQRVEVFLDANENPFPPYPGNTATEGLNRYPEPQPGHLLDLFAAHYGVERERLLITRGADEAIDLLVRAFCRAEHDAIVVNDPAFAMYEMSAKVQGAAVRRVPLVPSPEGRFDLDVPAVVAAAGADGSGDGDGGGSGGDGSVKLVFVCSPNNPTGGLARREDVLAVAGALFGRALVVVDETYVDFSGQPSLARDQDEHPNIVVLRTLSKEYSLAGERCGVTIAHPAVIDLLGRILAPYPLTQSAIRAVTVAMSPPGLARARDHIRQLLQERAVVEDVLRASPGVERVFPSDANFLLVRVTDPPRLMATMHAAGVKIRDRSTVPGIEGCVRISIGTPDENQRMLDAVAKYAATLD